MNADDDRTGSLDDLLAELAAAASAVGPVLVPPGSLELLRATTDLAQRLFGATAVSIARIDESAGELVYLTATGPGAATIPGMRLALTRGLAGFVASSGQAIAVEEAAQDPRFARDVAERTGYIPGRVLAVPCSEGDRVHGVLSIFDRRREPGPVPDLELAHLLARQVTTALRLADAFANLGRALLTAAADAARDGSSLAEALQVAADDAPAPGAELANLAAQLAELRRLGPRETEVMEKLVAAFADYARPPRGRRR